MPSITVLEPTGVPVTGTPAISLEFTFIINRCTIYITTSCPIDRWLAIYKCFISFDLHMHQVTSFKHWSPILPSATQTLGDILVYVLPRFLPNLPKMCKKRAFLLHLIPQECIEPRSEVNKLRNIDGEPSINDVLNRWRTCDRYTCISRTVLLRPILKSHKRLRLLAISI